MDFRLDLTTRLNIYNAFRSRSVLPVNHNNHYIVQTALLSFAPFCKFPEFKSNQSCRPKDSVKLHISHTSLAFQVLMLVTFRLHVSWFWFRSIRAKFGRFIFDHTR